MWMFEPFQFAFMQSALLIALVVAIPCALLSVFLVLKGWALMGDAMSHAVFPGIVLAWVLGIPLAIGAFVAGLLCAVASGFLQDNSRIKQDTVLGIVFSGMFAVGLILYIAVKPEVHLDHILFGDMLGITRADIIQTLIIAALIVAVIALKWRDLMLFSFDPQQAQVCGLPARLMHYGLLCMVSLTIVATLKAVGIILSISLLIAPGAIAVLLTTRFSHALLIAVLVSVLVSLSGVYLSFFLDSAPAPTIVVLFALVFIVAMIVSGQKTRRLERQQRPVA
ncbi:MULTISPECIES: metal ABC transporter permease [Pantoea]|uniref:Metal ABC transporter permease n=1 Tax=Pantoea brenneri TaxID=472694 RepID=A0ABU9MLY5_9GAMM|nr:metal ABC transporter permease [Pantoea sp. 3.5.1]KKD30520.1 iron ABC transporter permease [Pantoea sp. 3.5.1]